MLDPTNATVITPFAQNVLGNWRLRTFSPADLTELNNLLGMTINDLALVQEGGAMFRYGTGGWKQITAANFADLAARTTAYAKAGGAYLVDGAQSRLGNEVTLWRYYGVYNAVGNPGGARVAGWYPAEGADVFLRMGGSNTAQALTTPAGTTTVQAASLGVPISSLPLVLTAGVYENRFFKWTAASGQLQAKIEGRYIIDARLQYSNSAGVSQSEISKNALGLLAGTLSMQDFAISASATHTAVLHADEVALLPTDVLRLLARNSVVGSTNPQAIDASMLLAIRWQGVVHA